MQRAIEGGLILKLFQHIWPTRKAISYSALAKLPIPEGPSW